MITTQSVVKGGGGEAANNINAAMLVSNSKSNLHLQKCDLNVPFLIATRYLLINFF